MAQSEKVLIIGLDSADPHLVFERWRDDLPNLRRLAENGLWGRLESCIPPLTVPAWTCMAAGKDPGALGVYGLRTRRDWSYEDLGLATNIEVRQPRLWDHVARAGLPTITIGVPQTFPIVRRPRGCLITCFLTPSTRSPYTYPPELADELARLVGDYLLDVADFRTPDKPGLLKQIQRLGQQRFTVCRHLLRTRPWSLLWMVEMGVDRIQHGFWRYMDERHPRHEPHSPFADAIRQYYRLIDEQIGGLLDEVDRRQTAIWVVSDHGAQCLEGAFCINDWLLREGLLALNETPTSVQRFELANVDWSRTRAWADGGYTGQIFINRAGREPRGIVTEEEYELLRDALASKLTTMCDPRGRPLRTQVYKPEEIYSEVNGCPPDLIVHCAELRRRCVGSVGHEQLFTSDDEGRPDDANHTMQGMYILAHPALPRRRQDASLYDVAPTTLQLLGLGVPRGLRGRSLLGR